MSSTNPFVARLVRFARMLGPGVITGASDDDPSGIATYSQAGAMFGLGTLWTALFTLPLMAAVQQMCARIGIVTSKGLTTTLKEHYPRSMLYVMLLVSFPAITLNIGADLQGMGAVAHLLIPGIPPFELSIAFTVILVFMLIRFQYKKIARILKWLCLSLFLYFIVPFLVDTDWPAVLHHMLIPGITLSKEYLGVIVAIFGTTISPYLFFWQTTMEAEDRAHSGSGEGVNHLVMENMATDVDTGMILSNVTMLFIILTTGVVLHPAGITNITTVQEAAEALQPLAGQFSYLLFAMGVIGVGMIAIPVLAGTLSYIAAETFNWEEGLDKKFSGARGFYGVLVVSLLVGLSLDFLNISPIKALIYTALLYGITAPVMVAIVMHICNRKEIMGEYVNGPVLNILGTITLLVMTAAAAVLVYLEFA